MVREAILKHTPASPRELNTEIPAGLDAIINKALEKDRALRYQSAAEMRAHLEKLRPAVRGKIGVGRSVLASVVAFLVIGAALWFTRSHRSTEGRAPGRFELKQRQLTASSSENGVTGGAISPDASRWPTPICGESMFSRLTPAECTIFPSRRVSVDRKWTGPSFQPGFGIAQSFSPMRCHTGVPPVSGSSRSMEDLPGSFATTLLPGLSPVTAPGWRSAPT